MENTQVENVEIDVEELAKEQEFFERQYKRKINDMFLSQSIPLLNKMVGLNGKEQFSLGLFLKLPIDIQLEKVQKEEEYFSNDELNFKNKYEAQDKIVEFIIKNLKAFVIAETHTRRVAVNMVFKYRDQKDLDNLLDAIQIEVGAMFLVFVYLHEIQHILRRHATATFNDIMLRTAKKVDSEKFKDYYKDVHYFANCAQDYAINNALLSMLKKTGNYNLELNAISQFGLFDEKYIDDNEIDILEKILKQQPDIKVIAEDEHSITLEIQEKNEDGTPNGDPKIVTVPKQGGSGDGEQEEDEKEEMEKKLAQDKLMDAIGDSIENHIQQQQERGDGSFVMNKDLGQSIKTNVDWFDQLKSTLFTIVHRKTRQTLVNWSKLNSKYSHSHKSPTHRNIENTLDIILSVDNSGSMCDEALKKLLYIIEEKKGKINKLTILKHTDTITQVLENEKDERKILEFLGTRDNGGTSHRDVFRYLEENVSKHDIEKSIYISFSDNYSDIESQYYNFKNIQKITKVWLNADGVDVGVNVSGMKVKIF